LLPKDLVLEKRRGVQIKVANRIRGQSAFVSKPLSRRAPLHFAGRKA
jgi:hypothetical protein